MWSVTKRDAAVTRDEYLATSLSRLRPWATTGVSRRTWCRRSRAERIRSLLDAAEAEPEKHGKLLEDMDRLGRANGPYEAPRVQLSADVALKRPFALTRQAATGRKTVKGRWWAGPSKQTRLLRARRTTVMKPLERPHA
jgi:hypothetical protein